MSQVRSTHRYSSRVLALVALGLAGCAGPPPEHLQNQSSDEERIQGTWEVVTLQFDGKNFDAARGDVWVVNGREMRREEELVKRDKPLGPSELRVVARQYSLDSAKRHIEWSTTQEFKIWRPSHPEGTGVMDPYIEQMRRHRKGIYELDGDRLKICFGGESLDPGDCVRPPDFETKDGDSRSVFVLKRRRSKPE